MSDDSTPSLTEFIEDARLDFIPLEKWLADWKIGAPEILLALHHGLPPLPLDDRGAAGVFVTRHDGYSWGKLVELLRDHGVKPFAPRSKERQPPHYPPARPRKTQRGNMATVSAIQKAAERLLADAAKLQPKRRERGYVLTVFETEDGVPLYADARWATNVPGSALLADLLRQLGWLLSVPNSPRSDIY